MVGVVFCQQGVDLGDLFPVQRRGVAVVLAVTVEVPQPVWTDTQHLRIFLRQPLGSCAGGRGEDGVDAVGIEPVDDLIQPAEVVNALFRLQLCPGENAQAHTVDVGFPEQPDVLFQNLRLIQPLFRVIVAAVQHMGKFRGRRCKSLCHGFELLFSSECTKSAFESFRFLIVLL